MSLSMSYSIKVLTSRLAHRIIVPEDVANTVKDCVHAFCFITGGRSDQMEAMSLVPPLLVGEIHNVIDINPSTLTTPICSAGGQN